MRAFIIIATILSSIAAFQTTAICNPSPATTTAMPSKNGLEEKVVEHTLKNGMKLLIAERRTSPTVSAWIRFRVGSVDERSDERGIAHMLEHMLFKGTKTLGTTNYAKEKPLLDEIEKTAQALIAEKAQDNEGNPERVALLTSRLTELEANAGNYVIKNEFFELYSKNGGVGYNAYTSRDGTAYLINLPSNKLELWAAIESDRLKNAVLREFYTERAVVMEERRRSYESNPQSQLWETFLASSFLVHPYAQPTIGWMSDIENLTRTKAERFFHDYYGAQNAIIAIVGDADPKATIDLVERYFGDIPPGKKPAPVTAKEPKQKGERRIELKADAEPLLIIAFHKPSVTSPDDYVFDAINSILGQGRVSRLRKKLVVEKQIAADIAVFDAPGSRYPNLFVITATPHLTHTLKDLEHAILDELDILKREPVSQRELQRILNGIEFDEAARMSSNGGLARSLTEFEAVTGSWRYLIEYRRKIAAVTPTDIQRVAREYFTDENRIIGFITKKEAAHK